MPLIDAYIKCTGIEGSYKGDLPKNMGAASARLKLSHTGWSEILSFDYTLGEEDGYPKLSFEKPVDGASNDLYLFCLKNESRGSQKGSGNKAGLIDEIKIEMCRWVDTNADGVVDEFAVFIEYVFKFCRIKSYATGMDFEAEEVPAEKVEFSFQAMTMNYHNPEETTKFGWNFARCKEIQ
jgi:type VI protein secretion system component Hcp